MEINQYLTDLEKLPLLKSREDVLIPAGINLLINDVSATDGWKVACSGLLKPEVIFLETDYLSGQLESALIQSSLAFYDKRVAALFPMNGSREVQNSIDFQTLLPAKTLQEFKVPARRSNPNTPPQIELPDDFLDNLKSGAYDTLLVVDDVIVTGSTLKKVQDSVFAETDITDDSGYNPDVRFGWSNVRIKRIPVAWYAASWLGVSRTKDQSKNLSGFREVDIGIYYKGENGQPPLNSISTWFYDRQKGQQVLERYAGKYARDPEAFVRFIEDSKGGE